MISTLLVIDVKTSNTENSSKSRVPLRYINHIINYMHFNVVLQVLLQSYS